MGCLAFARREAALAEQRRRLLGDCGADRHLSFERSRARGGDDLFDALTGDLTAAGVPHTVRHQRGGSLRLEGVGSGEADVAVVSAGVLDAAPLRLGDDHPVRLLAPASYYGPGRLVVVRRTAELEHPPVRVAIDRDSPDHTALTEATFPAEERYAFVNHPFPDAPAAVLRGDVDAGIWHRSHSVIPLDLAGLSCLPLPGAAETVWSAISAGALVGESSRQELGSVLRSILIEPRWTDRAGSPTAVDGASSVASPVASGWDSCSLS